MIDGHCGTPTGGAKRRREERSSDTATPIGAGAIKRLDMRNSDRCEAPQGGAIKRLDCGTPTEGAKRRREEQSRDVTNIEECNVEQVHVAGPADDGCIRVTDARTGSGVGAGARLLRRAGRELDRAARRCPATRPSSSTRAALSSSPSRPEQFVVHVSADNRYRLYVNGEQVSSGPQRSDVMHWRYETVDLAPKLRAGRNVIAALVWNWGAARARWRSTAIAPASCSRATAEREAALVNTGPGWKLRVDSAYRFVRFGSARSAATTPPRLAKWWTARCYPWGWESSRLRRRDVVHRAGASAARGGCAARPPAGGAAAPSSAACCCRERPVVARWPAGSSSRATSLRWRRRCSASRACGARRA